MSLIVKAKGVRSRSDGNVDIMRWKDDVHEEADNRIVIHIADMIRNDITIIKLRTVDSGYRCYCYSVGIHAAVP